MNKIENTLKIKEYEKFKCTADKCKFTCCKGWDINVDIKTYDKWKSENLNYLLDNVKFINGNEDNKYMIKKETKGKCPLLNEQGLCKIVLNHGDEHLSSTCRKFPRIENIFDNVKEVSLSCSCPEVVNIISNMTEKHCMEFNELLSYIEDFGSLKIRECLVNIFQKENITIENKIILSYNMIFNLLNSDDLDYEDLIEVLGMYNSQSYIEKELYKYREYEKKNNIKYLKEINSLFIDIIENYRNVPVFKDQLKDIYKFAKENKIENTLNHWKEFKTLFKGYNNLIENCIVSKIFSNCINDDLEEMTISLEIIILEYLFIRYATFLKYCNGGKNNINDEDIKDYIVIFSRVIGNNSDAVIEFLLDVFQSDILEFDYISYLILS